MTSTHGLLLLLHFERVHAYEISMLHTYQSYPIESQYISRITWYMMTSSNGDIFRVTGPLCGEFTGPGEFPTQRPVTRSFNFFFDLRLNKRLSKQPWGWWFETPPWSLWRQCNEFWCIAMIILCMRPANERWRYTVTPSLIGWAHTQNDPCIVWDL